MRVVLMFLILSCAFIVLAQEPTAPAPDQASQPAAEVVVDEAPAPAPAPTGPTVEERLKTLEEKQAKLVEENKRLKDDIEAKKAAVEEAKKDSPKNRKAVEFSPYGFIKLYGWANDAQFRSGEFPLYVTDEHKSTTGMSAKHSRVGTKIFFPRLEGVKLVGTIEVDFFTNMADTGFAESYPMIRMRHAFMDLAKTWDDSTLGFKAGQTWAVATPTVFPAFVNPTMGWGTGNLWQRMPLVSIYFAQKFAKTFSFNAEVAAARAMSGASSNRNGFLEVNIDAGDASHIPQVQGQLSLTGSFSGFDLLVAVGGAWGRESYKGGVFLNNDKTVRYTGGLTDVFMVNPALKLAHEYGEIAGKFFWGQNLDVFGAFGGALVSEDVSSATATSPAVKRVLGGQRSLGYWAQLTGKPLPGWKLHVGYGAEDPDERQAGSAPLFFHNSSIWVSSFYNFLAYVTVGFQWQQVRTENIKVGSSPRKTMTGNVFMGSAQLDF